MITGKQQNEKVWFVTGASKGLGADLVIRLIGEGYKVVATSRKRQPLIDLIGEHANFFPLTMDITSNNDVKNVITSVLSIRSPLVSCLKQKPIKHH